MLYIFCEFPEVYLSFFFIYYYNFLFFYIKYLKPINSTEFHRIKHLTEFSNQPRFKDFKRWRKLTFTGNWRPPDPLPCYVSM